MSGVVDVLFYSLCGGCLVWSMSGVVDVLFLPMVWWMSGAVDVCVVDVVQSSEAEEGVIWSISRQDHF